MSDQWRHEVAMEIFGVSVIVRTKSPGFEGSSKSGPHHIRCQFAGHETVNPSACETTVSRHEVRDRMSVHGDSALVALAAKHLAAFTALCDLDPRIAYLLAHEVVVVPRTDEEAMGGLVSTEMAAGKMKHAVANMLGAFEKSEAVLQEILDSQDV